MAELIDKNKLLEDIYNDNPQDVMKYIAQYPETKYKCKQGECTYPMRYCPYCGTNLRRRKQQ